MSKQLQKLHKRKVARAKMNKKVSEPDVRTPEQIKAARDASRPAGGHGAAMNLGGSAPTSRGNRPSSAGAGAKTDA
jgi:hypothetical protein